MYLHFTPFLVQRWFPRYTWRRSTGGEKKIFLTFDDGPVPEVTPFVLEVLEQFKAKATFFCVGENVRRYPEILQQVLAAGHRVGNHTQHHLNGFSSATPDYIIDVQKCADQFIESCGEAPTLFRPPYGRLREEAAKSLLPQYEIIMWDVLSADYDQKLEPEKCLKKSIRYTKSGSIVVFHDNIKAYKNLAWVLPRYLEHFSSKGFTFNVL